MRKLYYRADRRLFKPGDKMRTAGDFISMHSHAFKAAEEALEANRPPGKMPREKCLMVFENIHCAKKIWATMNEGGKLYTVKLDEGDILHRGDMHLVERIATRVKWHDDVSDDARAYWAGQLTCIPCLEVLVRAGTIVDLIGNEQDRESVIGRYMRRRQKEATRLMKDFMRSRSFENKLFRQ
jgi:hypothetical protein